MTKIPFTKMHGAGNDYIYVNTMLHEVPNPSEAAILWSDRHKGIGSDGLVLIDKSPVPEADFSMRIFNADGSEAMMCGNASRCIGKYLYERGLTDKTEIRLLTLSGVKTLNLLVNDGIVESVTVDMGVPVLEDESQYLPARNPGHGTFISMGNPHYVIFTDNVDQVIPPSHSAATSSSRISNPMVSSAPASGNEALASPWPVARVPVLRQSQPSSQDRQSASLRL